MSAEAHRFDPTILREYDVRGIVGQTLHAADARALGRALATIGRRPVEGAHLLGERQPFVGQGVIRI